MVELFLVQSHGRKYLRALRRAATWWLLPEVNSVIFESIFFFFCNINELH